MTEHMSTAIHTNAVPQIRLCPKPDRRQLLLGGNRRSTDVKRPHYPYGFLYSALLAGQALLLLAFVGYLLR